MTTFTLILLTACTVAAAAEQAPPVKPFALEGNVRARYEAVEDDAFARSAEAATLRLRLAARMQLGSGWSALVEGEGVAALDNQYNSGVNGRTAFPAIADPTGVELNQAWLAWRNPQAGATVGRQRILLENQRWVGNSGWRQNEQTFDALALEWKASPQLSARYWWLDRVHRVNGDDARDRLARERELDTHLLDLAYVQGTQSWGAYAYAHEDRDVANASTLSTGLRWNGSHTVDAKTWAWRVEVARQNDYANNPFDFSHNYWLVEPSLTCHELTWRAGWEHLGGDGRHALQTPLATLHAFNGWADKFLVTPAGGLEDRYLGAAGALGHGATTSKLKWALTWHDYQADRGGSYGSEWNASLSYPLREKLTGLIKLADYQSDGFARDTSKVWLQVEWLF